MTTRHYERALADLRELGAEFAQRHPALAPMLGAASDDPDVERLLEGCAFLTGLLRQQLDDEFPEFVQEIAQLLFPRYLRPQPAATIVAFAQKGRIEPRRSIAAGTELASLPVDGTRCRFRTVDDVELTPLTLVDAAFVDARPAPTVRLSFMLQAGDTDDWRAERIRLYANGGYSEAARLVAALAVHTVNVTIGADRGARCALGAGALQLPGLQMPLWPDPGCTAAGLQPLHDYLAFPEKLLFVDLVGIQRWDRRERSAHFVVELTLQAPSDDAIAALSSLRSDSFLLDAAVAVNLFSASADPIVDALHAAEYRVVPSLRPEPHYQVFSIDRVVGYRPQQTDAIIYPRFGAQTDGDQQSCYRSMLRQRPGSRAPQTYLTMLEPPNRMPTPQTLALELTCTNGALPQSLRQGELCVPTSATPERIAFANIRPISAAANPPLDSSLLWRILSQLSLNFVALADADNLRALLSVHLFAQPQPHPRDAANRRRIAGIVAVDAVAESRLVGHGERRWGYRIRLRCDPAHFAGSGDLYLFGCVIDRFFASQAPLHGYCCVELENIDSAEVFRWPPRIAPDRMLAQAN